jgi:hypothetical protein
MNQQPAPVAAWKREFARLRRSLAQTGYISQGTVLRRTVAASGRSGCQWTRKAGAKTITVALSREQFDALKQAVSNERKLWKTIRKMEKLSHQILFATLPDTRHRKPLSNKVLGIN